MRADKSRAYGSKSSGTSPFSYPLGIDAVNDESLACRNLFPGDEVALSMKVLRLLLSAKTSVFRTLPLMRDARVPLMLKIGALALAVLIISPIDLFSDIPGLGLLDDAALLSLLCYWFVRLASRHTEPAFVGSNIVP